MLAEDIAYKYIIHRALIWHARRLSSTGAPAADVLAMVHLATRARSEGLESTFELGQIAAEGGAA